MCRPPPCALCGEETDVGQSTKSGDKSPHGFVAFLFGLLELDFVQKIGLLLYSAFSISSSSSATDIKAMLVDPMVFWSAF